MNSITKKVPSKYCISIFYYIKLTPSKKKQAIIIFFNKCKSIINLAPEQKTDRHLAEGHSAQNLELLKYMHQT